MWVATRSLSKQLRRPTVPGECRNRTITAVRKLRCLSFAPRTTCVVYSCAAVPSLPEVVPRLPLPGDTTPGKERALIEVTEFFAWLETSVGVNEESLERAAEEGDVRARRSVNK